MCLYAIARLQKFACLGCLLFFLCTNCQAQNLRQPRYQVGVVRTTEGRVFIGADPNDAYQVLCQLSDRQVQDYVGMTEIQKTAYSKIISEFQHQRKQLAMQERSGELPKGTTLKFIKTFVSKSGELLEELLNPEQSARLRNALFRLEARRIGLGEALVHGRLSDAIGVHDGQKNQLSRKAEQIGRRVQEQIATLQRQAEKELLKELAPEQRAVAESMLGAQFEYEELTSAVRAYRTMRASNSND